MLSEYSGYSIQHLHNNFQKYLSKYPPDLILPKQNANDFPCLLIDGLWFGRWFVLMVYRQSKKLAILHISASGREVATKIERDLKYILSLGYQFKGVVSDEGTGIISAVKKVFKFIPHQICLAHLHRTIISALSRNPKNLQVKELKNLADHIFLIESKEALKWWTDKLNDWIKINYDMLRLMKWDNTGKMWYAHEKVRKAIRILKELPFTSFKFLDFPLIPKTTNEIEAQFGHLGKRWLAHRGLKREKWKKFLQWFVYFYNEKKLSQKKS